MSAANQLAPGVEFDAGVSGDRYQGKPEALIAAGVITAAQLPAMASVTFFDGMKVDGRKVKATQDERWMQVTFIGRNLRVTKGIPADERARRQAARRAEIEEIERNTPKQDIGEAGALEAFKKSGAGLEVGDCVYAGGEAASVTGGYRLRTVRSGEGEYLSSNGNRIDYRWGYVCKTTDGKEYFFAAHEVTAKQGRASHLRLAYAATPAAPPMAIEPPAEVEAVVWPFPIICGEPV